MQISETRVILFFPQVFPYIPVNQEPSLLLTSSGCVVQELCFLYLIPLPTLLHVYSSFFRSHYFYPLALSDLLFISDLLFFKASKIQVRYNYSNAAVVFTFIDYFPS